MFKNKEIKMIFVLSVMIAILTSVLCIYINRSAGIICCIGFIILLSLYFLFTRYRYKKLSGLSDYVKNMADGKVNFDIRDNEEGELSILKNEIYKLCSRLLEQADSLKKDKMLFQALLYNISHQLKTPLTSLNLMADLLDHDDLPMEKRKEFSVNLHKGLSRMEWLVLTLLKIAKLDAGTIEIKSEPIPVSELIKKSLEPLLITIELSEQTVVADESAPFAILCDVRWTAEALTNIIKNAAEHSPKGAEISIQYGDTPIFSWISVTDKGSGIDKDDLPHLFERFYKGRQANKDSVGIGLAMSMSILRLHNGDIEVKSEAGKGSTFILKFYKTMYD